MLRNKFAEILTFKPEGGGFLSQQQNATTWVSSEGMDLLVQGARIMEHWAGHFEALPTMLCANHGLPCTELNWEINDYICKPLKDPAHTDFLLFGYHDGIGGFCVSASAHSVPAGLAIQFG